MLQAAGFEVEEAIYQNRAAKLAWWLNSSIFKRNSLPAAQSKIFDRLVPLLKALDGERPKSGLSLIVIGRKGVGSGEWGVGAEAAGGANPTATDPVKSDSTSTSATPTPDTPLPTPRP
jgi:hypothetical protein